MIQAAANMKAKYAGAKTHSDEADSVNSANFSQDLFF